MTGRVNEGPIQAYDGPPDYRKVGRHGVFPDMSHDEVERCVKRMTGLPFGHAKRFRAARDEVEIILHPAGHVAGAAAVEMVAQIARDAGYSSIALVAINGADRFWAAQGFAYEAGAAASYGDGAFAMRRTLG